MEPVSNYSVDLTRSFCGNMFEGSHLHEGSAVLATGGVIPVFSSAKTVFGLNTSRTFGGGCSYTSSFLFSLQEASCIIKFCSPK